MRFFLVEKFIERNNSIHIWQIMTTKSLIGDTTNITIRDNRWSSKFSNMRLWEASDYDSILK